MKHLSSQARAATRLRAGFSLIEVMVVLAILALLLAIITPLVSAARETAMRAKCASNMSQIHRALATPRPGEVSLVPSSRAWNHKAAQMGAGPVLICPKDDLAADALSYVDPETSGSIKWLPKAPPSVDVDALESDTILHAFPERRAYILPSAVAVNISKPGSYATGAEYTAATGLTIPAGTVVDSDYIVHDRVISGTTPGGEITFPGEVMGLIVTLKELNASDPVLGAEGTFYPTGAGWARGLEGGEDKLSLGSNLRTLTIDSLNAVSIIGDHMRVVRKPSVGVGSSYGMNNQVGRGAATRDGQVLLVEYERTEVDMGDDFDVLFAPRHLGRANLMTYDGSIQSVDRNQADPVSNARMWLP